MLLITSAAYVDGELASEFGNIPPCFLPIGNKRLYEHQIKLAKESGVRDVFISLPDSFELDDIDSDYFSDNDIVIIKVPQNLSLGESISYCWSYFEGKYKQLRILHGDTLFLDLSLKDGDFVYLANNEGYYLRAVIEKFKNNLDIATRLASENELILSGYFSFDNGFLFIRELHSRRFEFIESIKSYNKQYPLNFEISKKWLDFGHVTPYYRSRASMTTQRIFNGLKINKNTVIKSSENKIKMLGEYSWFNNLPPMLKIFCPNTLWYVDKENKSEYSIEYIYASSLSDLFVFARHDVPTWREILLQVKEFIDKTNVNKLSSTIDYSRFDDLYLKKTVSRLRQYAEQTGFDIDKNIFINGKKYPSLMGIAIQSAKYISKADEKNATIVHGDLCFSNILYNFRSQSIKLIDPRGIDSEDNLTIYGDQRYDLAKFAHSIIGLYDFIIAGKYHIKHENKYSFIFSLNYPKHLIELKSIFIDIFMGKEQSLFKEIMAIMVHLFLSMLPLHCDDEIRQTALMLNGIRLYDEYLNE